ncbi:TPA: GIY-YIG nuclease family protein [Klebsiella aerogenes]|nr:GIY-YIG nuclease family protein [Klebsiella aerogenes]
MDFYLLISSDSKYIKVGISKNASKRYWQLFESTPFDFEKMFKASFDNDYIPVSAERLIKSSLKKDRAFKKGSSKFNGYTEWFHYNERTKAIIKIYLEYMGRMKDVYSRPPESAASNVMWF